MPSVAATRIKLGSMLRGSIPAPTRARLDVAGVTGDYSGVAWQNKNTGEIVLWYIEEWGPREAVRLGAPPIGWKLVAAADFDTDGEGDLVFENTITGERALWMVRDGAVATSASLGIVARTWSIVSAGNADADGFADILFRNASTGDVAVWYMNKASVYTAYQFGPLASNYPELYGVGDRNDNFSGVTTTRYDVQYYKLFVGSPATGQMAEWVLEDDGRIVGGRELPSSIPAGARIAVGRFDGFRASDWLVHDQATGNVYYQPNPTTTPIYDSNGQNVSNGARLPLGTVDPAAWTLVAGFPVHSVTTGVLVFEANQFPDRYWRTTGCVSCTAFNVQSIPSSIGTRYATPRPSVFTGVPAGQYRIDLRCQSNFSFETYCPVGGNRTDTVTVTAGGRTEVSAVYH